MTQLSFCGRPRLAVIAGPAGSGKTTVIAEIRGDAYKNDGLLDFVPVVTTTTRLRRPNEVDGVHYHFKTPDEFEAMVRNGEFIEWAYVHGTDGTRRYGVQKVSLMEALRIASETGRVVVLCIEIQGYLAIKDLVNSDEIDADLVGIFISVPGCTPEEREDELRRRLEKRGDHPEEIEGRIVTSRTEFSMISAFDIVVVNRHPREAGTQIVRFLGTCSIDR